MKKRKKIKEQRNEILRHKKVRNNKRNLFDNKKVNEKQFTYNNEKRSKNFCRNI